MKIFLKGFTYSKLTLLVVFIFSKGLVFGQTPSGNCTPNTPFYNVDLSAAPNGTWTSPVFPRVGNCCGTVAPDKCLEFKITLSPLAVAINFQIASGAIPPGALFYQINCGPPIAVGSPICLNGPGPYTLTFCKPGNNMNSYAITSIAAPQVSPDDTVADGCQAKMYASGLLINSSITWSSIYPGPSGAYNSYLSCTVGCDSTVVTAQPGAPPYVDYVVCGQPVAGACVSNGLFCDTIRIHFSPPIVNSITPNPAVFCSNNPAGIVLTGNINGGMPPYSYAWTNGPNGSGTVVGSNLTYTATSGGNYSLIVYDKNYPTCPPKISNVSVSVTPNPTVNAGPDQTLCATSVNLSGSFAGSTGCIWTGGNGTFSPNNTTPNAVYTPSAAELLNGTIVLTLNSTGNGACSVVSDQMVIHIAPPISVAVTFPSVVCFGQTANVTSIATGGFIPYTYNWSNGATTSNLSNVGAGTYSLSVNSTAGVGCTTSTVITIALNPSITVNTSPNNSISCGTFAVVSATATGGTGSLSYNWSNGANTQSTNVYSGTYVVTVTDARGCTGTNTVSVLSSNSALVSSINQPGILCYGGSTTLSVSATGGFGGYTYQWSNGSTAPSISVGAGNYCCQVTDGGGCISSSCVNVVQSTSITIYIPNPPMICNGAATNVNAFVSGGQAPYSYSWSNGQISPALTAQAGNYALTVTDALGCVGIATVAITQEAPINAVVNSTATSCFGSTDGKASVNVVGGTAPYYYAWSPYGGSGSTATGLLAGNFNVTITDAIGCALTASIIVNQPSPLTVSVTVNNNVSCYGGTNGSAIAVPNGGNGSYTYQWLPGGSTVQSPNNLGAGNYIVTVTDSKGCFQSASTSLTQPPVLTSTLIGVTNVSCNGGSTGSATVTGVGGTTPYSYQWVPSGATGSVATNLSAGVHTVTITDGNFCTVQHTVNISQPAALTGSLSLINNVSCNGGSNGSAIINPAGGTAPYYYSWSTAPTQTTQSVSNLTAGSYSAVIVDSKNCMFTTAALTITQPTAMSATITPSALTSCSAAITLSTSVSGGTTPYTYHWSNGSLSQNTSVYSGSYTVVVIDNLGCSTSATANVQAASNALAASIPPPANICYGTSTTVSVSASGGFGGYTYLWGNGATTTTINAQAGQHCVTVTDAGGCLATACVNVIQNQPIVPSINPPSLVCPFGSTTLTASASGGQAPYTYLWNTGVSSSTLSAPAGNYTLTVSDVLGSSCKGTATVTVSEESPIAIFTGSTNVSCYGGNNGTASIYVNGGVPGYTYLWSVGGATTTIVGNLGVGTYSVLVRDNIGCTKSANITISQPSSPIQIVTTNTNITCNGASNGIVAASGTGGNGVFTYYWDPSGVSTSSLTNLVAGTYTVLVADTSGCYTDTTVSVLEPSPITILSSTIAATCGYSNGSATVTPSGGGGVYTYTWVPTGGNNSTISNVPANTYTVEVLDNYNCLRRFPIVIPSRLSTASPGFSVSTACPNTPSQFTDLSVKGNDSIVVWSWDFDDPLAGTNNFSLNQHPNHIFTPGGTYSPTLTIHTAIGCIMSFSLNVPFYPVPTTAFLSHSICANSSISFTNTSTISPGSITGYNWNFGDPASGTNNTSIVFNPVHYYTNAGTYSITLTTVSNNSCTSTATNVINVFPLPAASFTANNVCSNNANTFTNTSGGGFVKWYWNFGDSSPVDSTVISPSHTYTNAGTYPVILTTVSGNSCRNYDTLNLTVFPGPTVNFNAPSICLGNNVTFTDLTSVPTGSITSWAWDFGDFSAVSPLQNPTHLFGASGIFNVNLSVTSSNGCSAATSKTVGVYPSPVANFNVTNACFNALTNFNDQSVAGPGTNLQTWLWAFGDGSPVLTGIQNPTHLYALTGTFTPTLVVGNNFGCKDTIFKTVTISPNPVVSFLVDDTSGCKEVCTNFAAISSPPGLVTNWLWDFGDNTVTSTLANPIHCYGVVGDYSVSLTGTTANGCVGVSTQTTLVHIHPNPVASFIATPNYLSSSAPDVSFTNTSQDITSFTWYFGDGTQNSVNENPVHSYENNGEYCIYLWVRNNFGCTNHARECVTIEPDFTFYVPNAFTPKSTGGLNDFFTGYGTNIDKFEMWIFDRWGEMICHTEDIYSGWDGTAKGGKNPAKQDVYVYKIEVTDFRGDIHKYVGHVTLLR